MRILTGKLLNFGGMWYVVPSHDTDSFYTDREQTYMDWTTEKYKEFTGKYSQYCIGDTASDLADWDVVFKQ